MYSLTTTPTPTLWLNGPDKREWRLVYIGSPYFGWKEPQGYVLSLKGMKVRVW